MNSEERIEQISELILTTEISDWKTIENLFRELNSLELKKQSKKKIVLSEKKDVAESSAKLPHFARTSLNF